jgi:O-antigen ligase
MQSPPALWRSAGAWDVRVPIVALFIVSVIVLSGLIDLPGAITLDQLPVLDLEPVSLLGLLTIFYAFSAPTLWLARPVLVKSTISALWPLMALVGWIFVSFLIHTPTAVGLQNVLVISAFVGFVLLASSESYRNRNFGWLVRTAIVWAAWLAAALYAIQLFVGGWGSVTFLSAGGFALFASLGIVCHLGAWRYGRRRELWWAVALTLLIGASLSRIALGIALMFFPLSQLSPGSLRSWIKMGLITALIASSALLAVTYVEPLHESFYEGDLAEIGGVAINVSGRGNLWQVTLESYLQSPITGLGAGSSEEVLAQNLIGAADHPHNDYLRILHDYGPLGLGLLVLGLLKLLAATGRRWMRASRKGEPEASLHLAALLAVAGFAVAMVTSNVIVYVFFMAPLGALVGSSLGRISSHAPRAYAAGLPGASTSVQPSRTAGTASFSRTG